MIRHVAGQCLMVITCAVMASAHSGPPYPIESDRVVGGYRVTIWTDADTTDDGSAAGKFWLTLETARAVVPLPAETRATITVRPTDRPGEVREVRMELVKGDVSRQFAALVLDHEGEFAVGVTIDGPLGTAHLDTRVDATYDLRPPRWLIFVYMLPFLLVGILWFKLLVRRRTAKAAVATTRPGTTS